MNLPPNLPSRPMPKPTAQVEPYVDCLGAELAVQFFLTFGGAELCLSANPKGRSQAEALVGPEAVSRMADHYRIGERVRVPLAKGWLAAMLDWQGHSVAQIARTLRITDVSVRAKLKDRKP